MKTWCCVPNPDFPVALCVLDFDHVGHHLWNQGTMRHDEAPLRTEFPGGGVRDALASMKPRFDLLYPKNQPYELQFLTEFAEWMRLGAVKYADRNWELFESPEALAHAEASFARHSAQFLSGAVDEDHGSACAFNIMCIKRIRYKLEGKI